ncbi:MAG: hypothetical protein NT080_05590 [Spirochaetes bacterium]|nr:hypothetical protein [Spirochaetota bacterium]
MRASMIAAIAFAILVSTAVAPSFGQAGAAGTAAATGEAKALPQGFRGFELGMDFAAVESALKGDPLFEYRGEPDVSLLRRPNESIIEVSGLSYVRRAFFQFYDGKLFVMIFELNRSFVDHYSVFTELAGKYGKPAGLSPSETVWTDGSVRLSIERPLSVKYIALETLNALAAESSSLESAEEIRRQEFLGGF